jgi:hypothetical protein
MKLKFLALFLFCGLAFSSLNAQDSKYQGEVGAGYSLGVGTWEINRFTLETIHGVRLSDNFFIGAGIGFHFYSQDGESATMIPIFANGKAYLSSGKVVPYLSLDLGYGVGAGDFESLGGLYLAPAAGLSFAISEKNRVNLGLSYQSQKISESGVSISMNAIALKLAITF